MKGEVRSMVECGPDMEAAIRKRYADIPFNQPLSGILIRMDEGTIERGDLLRVGGHKVEVLATGFGDLLAEDSRKTITVFSELPINHMPNLAPDRLSGRPGALVIPWEEI